MPAFAAWYGSNILEANFLHRSNLAPFITAKSVASLFERLVMFIILIPALAIVARGQSSLAWTSWTQRARAFWAKGDVFWGVENVWKRVECFFDEVEVIYKLW